MERIFENLRENVSEGCFEDIVSMVEAFINEIEERTKIDAYKKRVAQYKDTADAVKKTAEFEMKFGNWSSAADALKKADSAQKKEFKHRLRTMIHDKKFGQHAMDKANKELYNEWKAKRESSETSENY